MSKIIKVKIALICVVCLVLSIAGGLLPISAAAKDIEVISIPLYVDGIRAGNGLKTGSTTYIPLRAFFEAMEVDATINWDAKSKTAVVTANGLNLEVAADSQYMNANGRYLYFEDGAKNMNGTMVVPVRELAKSLGVTVIWDEEHWTMNIDTAEIRFIESGETFYDTEDLFWLSRIISAESSNQPFSGMIAVGNVVLNRVADDTMPDTIYDVIFDTKHGVQFSPITSGSINNEPLESAVIAAKICLEGYSTVEDSLYFLNPSIADSGWFNRNRVYITSIGDHAFYA
jgi:Cell wall hydrolyses involved in spore germination